MNTPETEIQQAIGDPRLQLAIYTATKRLIGHRAGVVNSDVLPYYQDLRNEANAIKKHTIENLDYYLEQLESNVIAHGGQVVFCRTGQEAADFVLGLAKQRGAHMLVKSKSMTSEEIHFNERLEAHQLEAVETDLGEYILQLAHQRPYHIVAPALHLTRYDVAEVFTRELGAENEVVIEKQTKFARGVLRQKFLQAEIGVSGANFLVADSGAIVVVENEGNARLSTSAPKIHIAIAGIEKLIPRAQDLAVFLNLLGRSATGQPLTSYTSFLSGPRRTGEIDGPDEFYLLLLDNGRTKLLQDPEKRQSLYCIRCGACLNHCPVYRKIGGHNYPWVYSGPDRRNHYSAVSRRDRRHLAALCVQPVRRVRRSLPGKDRDSEAAAQAARRGNRGSAPARRGWPGAFRIPVFRLDRDASENLFAARELGIAVLSAGAAPRPSEEMGQ